MRTRPRFAKPIFRINRRRINFKNKGIMNWIKRKLGITEIIDLKKENNRLLKELIKLQKHHINNSCETFARKRKV